ncbi:TetR/AcrR family transcriptional regulator [Nonomuraea ferruginea]|uniref:TetR/AcrR family transcriptional regulator n=1 Tax=Nonomuraea ferruginea TaxID=46174 RepID=UPI0031EC21D3
MTHDGRRLRGQRSREAILDQAVSLASVEGLDGLSLGRLATTLGISKSGFFAHWRDKEQLQLDAVDWAARQWTEQIISPALRAPAGVRRLFALHTTPMLWLRRRVTAGSPRPSLTFSRAPGLPVSPSARARLFTMPRVVTASCDALAPLEDL